MTFTLIDKKQETPTVTTFVFKPDQAFTWTAGQLLHYTLPHDNPDDRGIERWFTISSAPFEQHPSITTRFAGEKSSTFKKALFALPIGSTIEADGLEGEFVVTDPNEQLVCIAGGIGITPFHSIFRQLDHDGVPITATLLYANATSEIPFKAELDALTARHSELSVRYITEPERITEETIRTNIRDLATPHYYVSGPEAMVAAFKAMLEKMGIAPEKIKHDFFPGYDEQPARG